MVGVGGVDGADELGVFDVEVDFSANIVVAAGSSSRERCDGLTGVPIFFESFETSFRTGEDGAEL